MIIYVCVCIYISVTTLRAPFTSPVQLAIATHHRWEPDLSQMPVRDRVWMVRVLLDVRTSNPAGLTVPETPRSMVARAAALTVTAFTAGVAGPDREMATPAEGPAGKSSCGLNSIMPSADSKCLLLFKASKARGHCECNFAHGET